MGWPGFFIPREVPPTYRFFTRQVNTTLTEPAPRRRTIPRGIPLGGTKDPLYLIGPRFP